MYHRHLLWPFLLAVIVSADRHHHRHNDNDNDNDVHSINRIDINTIHTNSIHNETGIEATTTATTTTSSTSTTSATSRSLSPNSARIGDFVPLACNNDLDNASCVNLSTVWTNDSDGAFIVPCGTCYTYDLGSNQDITVSRNSGIRIIGKLVFPDNVRNVIITTPSIIVEGKLVIHSNANTVGGENDTSIVFKITGKSNIKFKPTDENRNACPGSGSTRECNLGKKPFVVAGGQLDIDAIPDDQCMSHTPILDVVRVDVSTPEEGTYDTYTPFLDSCPSNIDDSTFIQYDFNDGLYGNWTGWWGGYVHIENNALKVTNREIKQQGPYLDITQTKPGLCLVPGQEYLLSVRIKFDKADGTLDNEATTCESSNGDEHCPQFATKMKMNDGTHINRWKARMNQHDIPNYGQWGIWHDIITFDEDELHPSNVYSVLYIDGVDPGVDISLDSFRISLPTENAYPNPDDVCGELIVNGDAEADDMNPFPMTSTSGSSPIFIKQDPNNNNNNYFHQPNRKDSGSSIDSQINVQCFEQGLTYHASIKLRIRSEFNQEAYFYFRYLTPNTSDDWSSHTYLNCPPQKWEDGWVTCSGDFMINELLANSEIVKVRMYFKGSRNINVNVDYDDMSIQYVSGGGKGGRGGGRVEKLVVSADDAQCWGVGANVHIGSSLYYSYQSEDKVPNGFDTIISDIVTKEDDDTLELTLAESPFIPILTVLDDEGGGEGEGEAMAADVALTSRNVKIVSDDDEAENKGAYVQVLHTPNIPQIIRGVEFENMGRGGEIDRYPLQLLYSGNIEGSEIRWSSIHGSNLRCIAIEGTGNVTVSDNVAYKNKGHCIYVGFESQDNVIEGNFVSNTDRTSNSDTVSLENDADPAAFRNRYNPNHYKSNIAVASRSAGFSFEYASETKYEDHTTGQPNPRYIAMGEFSSNKAKSNAWYGMRFHYLEQSEKVTISNAVSIKNRYYGIYVYQGGRLTIQNSLIADNLYNLDLRWTDEVKIIDTNIQGISQATKDLVHPPYYADPCGFSGTFVPFGYRMQTAILRWDGTYQDGVTPRLNKGADLINVEFSNFDHDGEEDDKCAESVPITFNTNDMRDGHWDYSSSFINVRFNGSGSGKIMDAKSASENGVSDILITDSDGSSKPTTTIGQLSSSEPRSKSTTSAGTFMSNKRYLTAFATGDCEKHSEGIVYCQNTCYRTVQLQVDQTGTSDYDLRVTNDLGVQAYIPGTMRYEENMNRTAYEMNYRRFSASLPSGNYELAFFQNGEAVWPKYAYEIWESPPECDGYVSSVDVSIIEPPLDVGECDQLIENGDAEKGLGNWLHGNDNDVHRGYLASLAGAGIDGSTAIGYFNRYRNYQGVGHNLDTRCFHQNLNSFYELKIWFRLEEEGVAFECDRFTTSSSTRCPKFVLKNVRYIDPEKEEIDWDWDSLPLSHGVATSNPAGEFNLLHGVLEVNEKYNSVHRAWLHIRDVASNYNLIVDDFTVTDLKAEGVCTGNFVRNAQLSTGDARFWIPSGTVKYDVVLDGDVNVLKVYDRSNADHGIRQDLHIDSNCFKEKDRIQFSVRYQIQDSNGSPLICDRNVNSGLDECAYMRFRAYNDGVSNPFPYVAQTGAAHADVENDEWAIMTGIHDLDAVEASHTSMYFVIAGPHQDNTIVIDTVSIKPLPKSCDQILVNPSFADGTSSFWSVSDKPVDISIYSPGADDDYALYFEHPEKTRHVVQQELDSRCIVEGQDYVLSAKLKLLDAANGQALGCDPDIRSTNDENHCPMLRLRGEQCNEDFHYLLWNQKQIGWDADTFNDYEYDIIVDANMASCNKITVRLGHYLPLSRALLIDDVNFSQKTTFAPTGSPTISPTKAEEIGPTLSPTLRTDAPTTSRGVSCPPVGQVVNLDAGSVILGIADPDTVCNVMKVTTKNGSIVNVPMARSYDSNVWERAPGKIASSTFSEEFLCYESGCQINLPPLEGDTEYHLTSRTYSLSLRDEYARFLETATYGARAEDLDQLEAQTGEDESTSVIADYLQSQMNTPMTSHREYWRTRANPRASLPLKSGKPDHPCDVMSRWRMVSFVRNDYQEWSPRILNVVGEGGNGPYRLYLDGNLRTVVDDFWLGKDDSFSFNPDYDYQICSPRWFLRDVVGGDLYIKLENEECVQAENPRVDITGYENEVPSAYILDLSGESLELIDEELSNGGDFILPTGLSDPKCDSIPSVPNGPVFGKLQDGSWLQFDPRIELSTNTPSFPLVDGGKSTELASGGKSYCSNVPRTFLNEDGCVLSSDACRPAVSTEVDILLDGDTIKTLFDLTNRYIYGMTGLHVVDQYDDGNDFPWKLPHPCTKSMRSRWMRKDVNECTPTDIFPDTHETLVELLSDESDTNPYIRDIYFPKSGKTENGLKCNSTDTDPEIEISFDDQCWLRVHDDHWSIFDLTYWVDRHPGGPYHIKKWAEELNSAFIEFPNGYEVNNHPMYRWHDNYHKFTYVGRYGDSMRLRDLPNDFRTQAVTDYFQDSANINTSGVLVCGSPGEIANNKAAGFAFDIENELDFVTGNTRVTDDKDVVWLMTSLNAQDQLRQRVAWALAQILVVVKGAIRASEINEAFLQYYDIFLRNAFGNYRDILKEISYAPLMAENLSFLESKSSAYVWERYRVKAQADENFAREIMQLFSIGILQLNLDGSPKLDENGNTALAYTNDDIMSLSRAWTGFNRQPLRGNTEAWNNRIDPMRLEASWRDKFPKSDTTGGYIGDYYPLCEDLPDKAFLKEGSTYRFLGKSVLPELMSDPFQFETDETVVRMILDTSSPLRDELCNKDVFNTCQFANTVVLSSSKTCFGIECEMDTVRVVQVTPDAFYEYVRTPCVQQSFFNNGKKLSPYYRGHNVMCGNPVLPEASEACCPFGSTDASRNLKYDGERMTLESAEGRCEEIGSSICSFYKVDESAYHKKSNYFWTPDTCNIHLKINSDGMVTIIHQPAIDASNKVLHLDENNENWFRVYWRDGTYPKAVNECDGACEVVNGDSCLCSTSVSKSRGFGRTPGSVEEMLDTLFIGFPDPSIVDSENYSSSLDSDSGITTHLKNGMFDLNTAFEYTDDKGRHFFVKNSVETVQVRGLSSGTFTGYSFRNAPQFMSFVPSEATVRDAQFETEATLDHYFYHDNTAPFLCLRLIQRLIVSNPSPRYVTVVATAFKTGLYQNGDKSFGRGEYGDMTATFAAIYLDREARTVALMGDPSTGSLREPLLKLMSVLRSMKFATTYPLMLFSMLNMKNAIGQAPHQFDTVFSFFLPEFEPYGPVGDASLVSPEATILDMPRIIGMLNGLFSLARYGLSYRESGFGFHRSGDLYLPSQYGILEYGRTSHQAEFSFETFEGPSLVGGFDNIWSGRHYGSYIGGSTADPKDPANHVYRTAYANRPGFYSQPVTLLQNTVVKFQFLASQVDTGATIGYSNDELDDGTWIFSDYSNHNAPNLMISNNEWISCQFEVPVEQFRIVLGKLRSYGESYFDNIQIGQGSGTFCDYDSPVNIEDKTPPGQDGYSGAVVDELATLLTSGRLSAENRQIIRNAYDDAGSSNDGLRIAQEMIFTSAEFHATNPINAGNQNRESFSYPPPTGKPYKALVYIMFAGGCDSFNMLAPHTCPKDQDIYQQYLDIRAQVALPKNDLLKIETDGQTCSKYGIHPDLTAIQELYNQENLLFFANTGVMSQAVDKSNYNVLTNTQLFAHNHMQKETKRVDPYETSYGTGVFGRVGDILANRGHNVGSFSVNTFSVAVSGDDRITGAPTIVNDNGVPPIHNSPERKTEGPFSLICEELSHNVCFLILNKR